MNYTLNRWTIQYINYMPIKLLPKRETEKEEKGKNRPRKYKENHI